MDALKEFVFSYDETTLKGSSLNRNRFHLLGTMHSQASESSGTTIAHQTPPEY